MSWVSVKGLGKTAKELGIRGTRPRDPLARRLWKMRTYALSGKRYLTAADLNWSIRENI